MMRRTRAAWRVGWVVVAALVVATPSLPAADDEITRAVATIKGVGREGKANEDAGPAWKTLAGKGGPALFPALEAIDDAHPTAANWLRTAVDAVAEGEAKAGRPLPADKLTAFIKDTKFAPSARRLAYELLVKQDPAAKDRLLPGFLNDPSPDLRRDAVAAALDQLKKAAPPTLTADLQKLFTFTRDKDQVDAVAKKLADRGAKVSVTEHFAFVTHWHLAGPFECSQGKALTLAYPAETSADLAATFTGKNGVAVGWKPFATADKYAVMDLNKLLGKTMNAAAYARAVVVAEKETPCEVRVASPNAVQIFLNGKKLFEREEYHHGDALDYHTGKGTLKPGENVVVVKVCQNNQTDTWAQNWKFQARVCESTGGPLPGLKQAVAVGDTKTVPLGFIPESAAPKEEKK